jgi:CzcA family heavy metal efflux pump
MMNALIRWSLGNRSAVVFMGLVLCGVGGVVAIRMPVDVFPDLTAPTVTVLTEAHGMAPAEVEAQITLPIESALNGAANVRRVRSSTAVGLSIVWVEFDWGTDIAAARQAVSEKVLLIAASLPPEVERPILAPVSSIMGEIMFLALASDRHTPLEVRTTADTVVRRRLLSIPGVSQVTTLGGEKKQYQVMLTPAKLRAYGISMNQVGRALTESNENLSAGFINQGGSEFLVTGIGRFRTWEDIGETVVSVVENHPIRVADLGEVRVSGAPKRGEGSANARPAVILALQKQPEANTLALTAELDRAIDDLQAKRLPPGMRLDGRIFRQADFIQVAVDNVLHALWVGAVLVVVIVLFFLANARATLITLTAMPLSLVAAVLTLKAFGATINTMTLGGMAIAIGALVDDAVIDVENVFRRLRENSTLPEERRRPAVVVVFEASVEIRSSILFATLVIGLVFLPLVFLPGVEGRLLRPLGTAYVVSLFASLLVAVTVTPALCHVLLPHSRAVRKGSEPAVVHALKRAYAKLLAPVLRDPWAVILPAGVLLGVAVAATTRMGRSFLPDFNEGSLTIALNTLPGTSLPESDALGRLAEEILRAHPEVKSVGRRTGRAEEDEHAQGVEASELDVRLEMKGRGKEAFLDDLRKDLDLLKRTGVNYQIGQPISHRIDHMLSGTRASIAVKIFGEDLAKLRVLAEKTRGAMEGVEGVVDLSVEQQTEIPILNARFDRAAMARHGLMMEEVTHTLEAAVFGHSVSRLLEGPNSFDVVLRVAEEEGWDLGSIADLPVHTPSGAKVPLKAVANIRREAGPNSISREGVERKIVVSCNVAGRDVGSVVRDIRERVDPLVPRPYRAVYGGQFEAAEEAVLVLAYLLGAVVLGIGLLLYMAFRSIRDALIVMINLLLALIGGVAGVFVSGGVLSVASIIGFITVFGIATRNGIMLVSHIRHLQEREGVTDFREAVFRGALERLAPILMTALAAGLALIPLALGGGKPGSEIQTPMAIVILFGLLSSMALNMVVVPAVYLRFGKPVPAGGAK